MKLIKNKIPELANFLRFFEEKTRILQSTVKSKKRKKFLYNWKSGTKLNIKKSFLTK